MLIIIAMVIMTTEVYVHSNNNKTVIMIETENGCDTDHDDWIL